MPFTISHIPSLLIMLATVPSAAVIAVAIALLFLKKQPSASRHFLWLLALGTSIEVVTIFPVGLRVLLPILPPKPEFTQKARERETVPPEESRKRLDSKLAELTISEPERKHSTGKLEKAKQIEVFPSSREPVPAISQAPVNAMTKATISQPWKLSSLCWWGWLLGLTIMLLKLAVDQISIQALLRDCSPAPEDLARLARSIQSRLGLRRSPKLLVAESNQIPFCYGLFHPVIVVPKSGDLGKQAIYIYHEMAHLVRNDLVCLFAGQISCAASWFNPLVWRAFQNLQSEGELAADDLVLTYGIGSVDYAKNLVELVETFQLNSVNGSVAVAMAQPKGLSRRIVRILNDSIVRRSPCKAVLATLSLVTLLAVFTALSVRLVEGQTASAAPLTDDDYSGDKEEKRIQALRDEGRKLKADEAAALEVKVLAYPDDVDDRVRLLGYYVGYADMNEAESAAAQPHLLWFIKHHPDSTAVGAYLMPCILKPKYAKEIEAAWLSALDKNPNSPRVIENASSFFGFADENERTEKLLKKGKALEPSNPYWPEVLGMLYTDPRKKLNERELALAETTKRGDKIGRLGEVVDAALKIPDYEKAEKYATELLQTVPSNASADELAKHYGAAIYLGNTALGEASFSKGDLPSADRYLLAAASTPSGYLDQTGYDLTLAKDLLAKGEQDAVVQFLTKMAIVWKKQSHRIPSWITQIQQGQTPSFQIADHPATPVTAQRAADLEKKVEADPHDLDDRVLLIKFYGDHPSLKNEYLKKLETHMLWIVNNAPANECADDPLIAVSTDRFLPFSDSSDLERIIRGNETYAKNVGLAWQAALNNHSNDAKVIANAAHYYVRSNLGKAEELMRHGQTLDPNNPFWNHNLGKIYELRMTAEDEPQRSVDARKALAYYEKDLPATSTENSIRPLLKVAELSIEISDLDDAAKYAAELLKAVPLRFDKLDRETYGEAIYQGNCILGQVAFAKGDFEGAKKCLSAAAATPVVSSDFGGLPDLTLAQKLLDKGEKETVLQFLKKVQSVTPNDYGEREGLDDLLCRFANGEVPRLIDDRSGRSAVTVSQRLDYSAIHPAGNFPEEFAWMSYCGGKDSYYPYNQEAYECWLPVGAQAPAGTWIRLSSKEGKTVYACYRGNTLRDCENKLCVDEVALKSLGWDFESQPGMTWQFVKSEDVPAGPWIPTSDDATTYAKRSIESKKFREALRGAMLQNEGSGGDDYILVDTLWAEQPRGVHYCSEIVYALTKEATVDQLNALVAKGAPVAVPWTEITPLMMAIARRNVPAVKWLLDHGEGKDSREFPEALNVGNLEIIQAFLDHRITVKSQNPVPELMKDLARWVSDDPVHHAVVDLIAQNGLLRPAPEGNPHSLLHVCEEKDTYLLRTLMKLGFNPDSAFTEKSGPLSGKTVVDVVREKAEKDEYFKPILDILLAK